MLKRRELVASAAAAGVAGIIPVRAGAQEPPPNILVIIVDQLRYPSVFPSGIDDADRFFALIMPNLYQRIWRRGVKFTAHYTAAVACSPARGTIVTGLYSHQTWMLLTIGDYPYLATSKQPWLDPTFPTYGKLLRQAGYQTPYIGKWHLSIPPQSASRLEEYGFQGLTYYDPVGSDLQGTVGDSSRGYLSDQDLTDQAKSWLASTRATRTPWCLTVSLINPHDIEDFWGGTEFQTYNNLFLSQSLYKPKQYFHPNVPWTADPLRDPPSYGYPAVPPNWESSEQINANKPSTQAWARIYEQAAAGGVSEDPSQTEFTIEPLPGSKTGIALAPYSYWARALDCYTQLMLIVDGRIGELLDSIPESQAENTVIVFTSDHGNFAGAHGLVHGKYNTLYEEAVHVPLIVADPSGRFTGQIDQPRVGLTSSVDILPMLVSLGHNGSSHWQSAGLVGELYGYRHDMVSMLRSASAPGRDYLVLATDEVNPSQNQYRKRHLLGLRTRHFKLGTYSEWIPGTTGISRQSIETEFYDYGTSGGRAKVSNTPDDPRAAPALEFLLGHLLPEELRAPLPAT